jgi:hypothetical protein
VLHLTAFIQILRHQLRYYHIAVVSQLVMLTLIPMGCSLGQPGWKVFGPFDKIASVCSTLFALGWSVFLLVICPKAWSFEVGCRNMWLEQICEAMPNVTSADEGFTCVSALNALLPVIIKDDTLQLGGSIPRMLAYAPGAVTRFYKYQIFVNTVSLSFVILLPPIAAFVGFQTAERFKRWRIIPLLGWMYGGIMVSTVHQFEAIKHFQQYTDDSEYAWGFGQISAMVAVLMPIVDFCSEIKHEGLLGWSSVYTALYQFGMSRIIVY